METLKEKEQEKVQYGLLLLKTQDRLPKKFVKLIRDGIYELRTEYGGNIYRVFFIFDDGKIVVLFNGFQKKTQNQDRFKRLIHRLSEMSDIEITKVEKLLDVVFDTNFKPDRNVELSQSVINDEEQSLDKSIQEAKNKLNMEQFEKNIERFRQGRRESNNNK